MNNILITGTSGFIGFHTAKRLLESGKHIIGVDNENNYYDVHLKIARRKQLEQHHNFIFYKGNLEDYKTIKKIFKNHLISHVIHLAAQAGVRYSLINPFAYIQSNIVGFHNILEISKEYKINKFIYASSSSVYGNNKKQPFSIKDKVDNPISLYAATKKSNELIAHSYSYLFKLPTIGLRFFTVYGPWGRPDMAIFMFTKNILEGKPINIFNYGNMKRDFTYIDDIVDGIIACLEYNGNIYEIFNLGSESPVYVKDVINLIEKELGKKAIKNYFPLQPGDVPETYADIDYTKKKLGRSPKYKIKEGIKNFIERYKIFYDK